MLHLFNNVFLQQDQYINQYNYNVVLSEIYATSDLTDSRSNPKVIGSGKNISEAFGENKTIYDMFLILSQLQTKVIIFADNINFSKILSCWLKSSTYMEKTSYELFVDCYVYKIKTIYGDIPARFAETIKGEWDNSISYDLSPLDFSPSYEFLMASALYDSDFKYKDKFKKLLLRFIKREIENFILEGRRDIDLYIMSDRIQEILGGKINTPANAHLLPRLAAFRSPYWTDNINQMFSGISYFPGKNSKIDISNATLDEMIELYDIVNNVFHAVTFGRKELQFEQYMNGAFRNSPKYLKMIAENNITDDEYKEIIRDLRDEYTLSSVPMDLRETILYSFITYLKDLSFKNDTSLYNYTLK